MGEAAPDDDHADGPRLAVAVGGIALGQDQRLAPPVRAGTENGAGRRLRNVLEAQLALRGRLQRQWGDGP